MSKIILFLIVISFNLGATENMEQRLKKYDYKIGINLKECGMELYVNDVELIYNSDMKNFDTTFGIGSFLKQKNNKLEVVLYSLNDNPIKFENVSECNFNFLARNRFTEMDLNSIALFNYHAERNLKNDISNWIYSKNESLDWIELLDNPKMKLIDDNGKYYEASQNFNTKSDFPEWAWVSSFQFNNSLKYFNELPQEQQAKLREAYAQLWNAMNAQDDTKIKALFAEMLEESSAADGGSIDSYYKSLGFSRLFDKEDYQLQPLNISATSKISKYLDNRVISVFKSPITFKDLESGQIVGVNPKFRFDGEKFIIAR